MTLDDDFEPGDYAALSNFLRGYLHQDAAVESGSAEAAARAFRRDADERETAIVRAELDRLLAATNDRAFSELARILEEKLGAGWRFRTRQEIERMRDALK